ncbi:AAA family ATPase [Sphingomonas sp. PsM26]|nr:AAA family ATPase [Sphingomonas sp. PsM26]
MPEEAKSDANDLRLYQVRVEGFKANRQVRMNIADRFTLLIGNNGSGKSTILQAIGFFSYIVGGKGEAFFAERVWKPQDIRFRSSPRSRSTVVRVAMYFKWRGRELRWEVSWGLNGSSLFSENVKVRDHDGAPVEDLLLFDAREGGKTAAGTEIPAFSITGSILPAIEFMVKAEEGALFDALVRWAGGIRSLELLSPYAMKGGTRSSPGDMGIKGDKLAGFLASLSAEQKSRVVKRLSRVYPIKELNTTRKRAGWIDMQIAEKYRNMVAVPVMHMSDGFMRLLALCSIPELGKHTSLVLLDEIEDGIEPHILPDIVDLIVRESTAQIIATSHSPLLVNHIGVDDVRYIARDADGVTTAVDADKLKSFSIGADFFGAGEMWTSSPVDALSAEASDEAKSEEKRRPNGDL